jgi:hypothetical protein
MNKLAKFITYLTFPGTWAVLGIFLYQPNKPVFVGISILMYVIIPMAFVAYMVYKKRFASLELATTKERRLAVPFAFIASLICIYFLKDNGANATILLWSFLVSFSLLIQYIFTLINAKISIHSLSSAAFATFFLLHFANRTQWVFDIPESFKSIPIGLFILFFLGINSLVFWARKSLKAHSSFELILGIAIGISLTFVNEYLLLTFLWN